MKKSLSTTEEEPSKKTLESSDNVLLPSIEEEKAAIGGAEKEPQPGTSRSVRQQTNVKSASSIKKILGNIGNIWKRKKTNLPDAQRPGNSQHQLPQSSLLPQETPDVKSRITDIFMNILQNPTQLGSVAEMAAILLPSGPVIATTPDTQRVVQLQQQHINNIFRSIIQPLLTEEHIARMVNQIKVEATFDEPSVRNQVANMIRGSIPALLKEPVIALHIEADPQTLQIKINRNLIREDVGSMVAIPVPGGGKAFARIDIEGNFRDFGVEHFCFKISGLDLVREGLRRGERNSLPEILPWHRPASIRFSVYDRYSVEFRGSGIETAPARWEAGQQLTLTGLGRDTTYLATIVSIGTGENPLVRLALPALNKEQKAALERNIPVLRENGEVTYGRAIYQFPDRSELSWWDPVQPQPGRVSAAEFLKKIKINEWLQSESILKEIPAVNTRIINTFRDILQRPTQLGLTADMITALLPYPPSQATAIAAMIQDLIISTPRNEEKVRQLNNVISTAILPRVNQERLADIVSNYDYGNGVDELSIRNQAVETIRGSLTGLLREPVIPVRIVQSEQGWRVSRDFTQADVGSMVVIPMVSGTTAFARVDFEDNDFCLKMSGSDQNAESTTVFDFEHRALVRVPQAVAVARASANIPYEIFLREASLVARAVTAGTVVGNLQRREDRLCTITIASVGTGENPFVWLNVPVNLSTEEKANLQRNIPVLQENGEVTYGRAIYQFPDKSELSWWDPVQRLDALLTEVYAKNIQHAVRHRIYQSGIDIVSSGNMLRSLLPDDLKALSVATLMEAGRVPQALAAELPARINEVIREIIWQRLSDSTLENNLNGHHFDYAQFETTGADFHTFVNQQADKIVQALLTSSLNGPVIPINIERTAQTSRLTANRNFTHADIGSVVTIQLLQGKTVRAFVDFENDDFCLKILGIGFDSETIASLNLFKVTRPSSDIPYHVIYEETPDQIVNGPERWQTGQQFTLKNPVDENTPFLVKIASIGAEEIPVVRLELPVLNVEQKRQLQPLLSCNIPVVRNGETVYGRISSDKLPGQNPLPVMTNTASLATEIAERLELRMLVDELIPRSMLTIPDDPGLSGTGILEHNLRLVDVWARPEVKLLSDTTSSFDGQMIVQLEDDPVVREAAAHLFAKHADKSVLMQLDSLGNYREVQSDPAILRGKKNLRVQMVGHGRGGENDKNHQTLAGYAPTALAEKLTQLNTVLGHKPQHVSLVGCSLAGDDIQTDYARAFAMALAKSEGGDEGKGIRASIAARFVRVQVDEQGRKMTEGSDGRWHYKISADKLVLSWNNQGELVAATSLAARLERVLALTDALASGTTHLSVLDTAQRADLAGAFRRAEGSLDVKKLILTTVDKPRYRRWRNEAHQLLQLQDAHTQLNALSVQAALQQSRDWNARQTGSMATLLLAGTRQHAEVEVQTRVAPQGLYIGNNSPEAGAKARVLGLAWSAACQQGESAAGHFFSGLESHALINEQKAVGEIPATDARQVGELRQQFDELTHSFSRQETATPAQSTDFKGAAGDYRFKTTGPVLMLSSWAGERGHSYSLYDPDGGEIRFSAQGPEAKNQLNTALHAWLSGQVSTPDSQTRAQYYGIELNGQSALQVYKVDVAGARQQLPALGQLQGALAALDNEHQRLQQAEVTVGKLTVAERLLRQMGLSADGQSLQAPEQLSRWLLTADSRTPDTVKGLAVLKQPGRDYRRGSAALPGGETAQQLLDIISRRPADITDAALLSSLQQVPVPGAWNTVNKFSSRAGSLMQGYGYMRGLKDLAHYNRLLTSTSLSEEEKNNLTFERNLAMASFGSNAGIDITQYGLGQLGGKLTRVVVPGSRIGQLGISAGMKAVRFGGPALSVLSSGFDVYSAYRAFSALATEPDPKKRQDLLVNGSLSVVGAAVAIGTGIAFALGGTAVAGPAGLAVGFILMVGGSIYQSVREIEDIKKYVALNGWQEFENGVRVFLGMGVKPWVANEAAYYQTAEAARAEYDRLLREGAEQLLAADSAVDRVYYSRGQVMLQEHHWQEIVVKDIAGGEHVIQDRISATEDARALIPAALRAFRKKQALIPINYQVLLNGQPRVRDSKLKYFTPTGLKSTDDTITRGSPAEGRVAVASFTGQRWVVGQLSVDPQGLPLSGDLHSSQNNYRGVTGNFNPNAGLNRDVHPDIAYFSGQGLYLLLADKDGRYSQPVLKTVNGGTAGSIRHPLRLAGDINSDGRDDMVIGHSGYVYILLAQEDGSFAATRQTIPQLPDLSQAAPVLADLDRDGRADLLFFARDSIHVWYGNADGQFGAGTAVLPLSTALHRLTTVPEYVHHLAGDVNGDGYADVVSFDRNGNIYTLLSSGRREQLFTAGPGGQAAPFIRAIVSRPFNTGQLQLKDMNDDGRADLVAVSNEGRYGIFYAQTDGRFSPVNDDSQREENGKTLAYRPNLLAKRGREQILGISAGSDNHQTLLSLNQAGEVNAHTFKPVPRKETITYFRLSEGNDTAVGDDRTKNIFEVGSGLKDYRGGRYADTFLLTGQPVPVNCNRNSWLYGGAGETADGSDLDDIVIAAGKPADGDGYDINLLEGYVKYRKTTGFIAKLRHIEHARGHKDTDDILTGDERANQLDGAGGNDELNGHGGNDILTLQAGTARGGAGTDTYRILQNDRPQAVTVRLEEAADSGEASNILLDHKAGQITTIGLEGNDVLLTLSNPAGGTTTLRLVDVYSAAGAGNERKLQHHYLLSTADGLMITGWPAALVRGTDGSWPFAPVLRSQYNPDMDRSWQLRMQGRTPTEIRIMQDIRTGKIAPGGNQHTLPGFIKLELTDTRFNDDLTGDEHGNVLASQQGSDRLSGQGGADSYVVGGTGAAGREVVIDNEDSAMEQDTLWLSVPIEELLLTPEGDDLLLSHRSTPGLHPVVRLHNFMQHERYRHLLLEENGTRHELSLNARRQPVLGRMSAPTEGNDEIIIYHISQVSSRLIDGRVIYDPIDALAGSDTLINRTGYGLTLNGGDGNDIIIAKNGGDNTLDGGAGHDHLYGSEGKDTLIGGTGHDTLSGGVGFDDLKGGDGDDLYLFASGDDHDTIFDTGGHDTLRFTSANITKERVWFKKTGTDLQISLSGSPSDGVTVKDYYRDWYPVQEVAEDNTVVTRYRREQRNKIEVIEVAGHQLTGNSINLLVTAMAAFPSADAVSLWQGNADFQQKVGHLWVKRHPLHEAVSH